MSGHRSPGSEQHRLTNSLRSRTNAERVSIRDRCVLFYIGLCSVSFIFHITVTGTSTSSSYFDSPRKNTGKHLPSQDNTDNSGDEEEGSRARLDSTHEVCI